MQSRCLVSPVSRSLRFTYITYVLFVAYLLRNAATQEDSAELIVEIVDKPAECDVTSQKGNLLKMHYTGYLTDGQKFDSRYFKLRLN
jgi:hypothetical protein